MVDKTIRQTKINMPRFFGTVRAEQAALHRVEVEVPALILTAAGTGQHIGHIARKGQCAQFIDGLQLAAGVAALTEHVQAVQQQPQLGIRLRRGGGKLHGDLRHIAGQRHSLDGGGDAVEHLFDLRVVHKLSLIHI